MANNWGERFKKVRELRSKSQRQVAIEAEVPQSTINRIERGKLTGVNSQTAIRIAHVLDISLDYLITGSGTGPLSSSRSKAKTNPCEFVQERSWIRTLILHDGIVTYDSIRHKDASQAIEGEDLLDRLDPNDRVAVSETIQALQPNQRPEPILLKMNLIWHTAWIVQVEGDSDEDSCVLVQLSTMSPSELQRQRFNVSIGQV